MTTVIDSTPQRSLSVDPVFAQRRERVAAYLRSHGGGVAVVPTAPEVTRNRDNEYPFRPDSYFFYLTGFDEPESWLTIDATGRSVLFCRPKKIEQEIWTGYRLGPDAAPEALGVSAAYPVGELDALLPELLSNQPAVWYPFAIHTGLESHVAQWLKGVRARARAGALCPQRQEDLCAVLDEMRLVKDDYEIALMRKAGEISALGHIRAMRKSAELIRAGADVREYHLEAEILHEFRRQGAQDVSYGSIVAGGANACVLHYRAGNGPIRDGELVLIDAGCELDCYAGDITRTFPANGRYTGPQRALYDVVLEMQTEAIAAIRPGVTFNGPHEKALLVLSQGLLDLGLVDRSKFASAADVVAERAYFPFYMHRTSHWLGMDVHDCGSYVEPGAEPTVKPGSQAGEQVFERPSRRLVPGMVLTVEPGIYVRPAEGVPETFWNIGIRTEDDALVTETGSELLTRRVPVDAGEIEAIMRS